MTTTVPTTPCRNRRPPLHINLGQAISFLLHFHGLPRFGASPESFGPNYFERKNDALA
jgi:hypothetical protein